MDTQTTVNEFDFTQFENEAKECKNDENWEACILIKRLITALKYFELLKFENENDKERFAVFMKEKYCHLLDDFIHLKNIHSEDLEEIHKKLTIDTKHSIDSCKIAFRHHRCDNAKNVQVIDDDLNIYKQTIEGLHFYLFHCFEVGLRVKKDDITFEEKNDDETISFDAAFAAVKSIISKCKKITDPFSRFSSENSKFNIKNEDDTTYVEKLYEYLDQSGADQFDIKKLHESIITEEYDTDSIEFDFFYVDDGNIVTDFGYECSDSINNFITAKNVFSLSFSIGLKFDYWDQSATKNINSGYKASELIIKPKHLSFKEEIAEYSEITIENYTKDVYVKALKYKYTSAVKQMKFVDNPVFKLCIESPSEQHLISLILYTDFTTLSSNFTATFRKNGFFETIKSITKRNSIYYWWSKYLRECIECFGESREGNYSFVLNKHINKLIGPYFSGMSIKINMPSFNMKLCSPTSTSKQIEVALKFSGPDGIIIEFDNPDTSQYRRLRALDLSFISNYGEEDERLFFAENYFIKVVSVRVIATKQNFKREIHCLYYLDTMLTGGEQFDEDGNELLMNKKDVRIIQHLFDCGSTVYTDSYVNSTFKTFKQNKRQITFNLERLTDANKDVRSLMINPMDQRKANEESMRCDDDDSNLFKATMFRIFTNVDSVIMITTSSTGHHSYSLSLSTLLSIMKQVSLNEVILKANTYKPRYKKKEYNWIKILDIDEKIQEDFAKECYMISKPIKCENKSNQYKLMINKNS